MLTDAWLHISPNSGIATTAPVSGLFVVFPESSALSWSDKQLVASNGSRVAIEGYLETNAGAHLRLAGNPMILNGTPMLEMINPALEWSKDDVRIKSIMLRSSTPIKTKQIIWVSDDPRDHKDGLILPQER